MMVEENTVERRFQPMREAEALDQGNLTIEQVREHVDRHVYRDAEGNVRGLMFAFTKSGGAVVTSQGDEIWMGESGEGAFLKVQADVETHEAQVVETEEVILADGTKIEYTRKPVTEVFGGSVRLGYAVVDTSEIDTAIPATEQIRGITFGTKNFEERVGGQLIRRESTRKYHLHDPFKNVSGPNVYKSDAFGNIAKRMKITQETTIATIDEEEIGEKDLRYITRITTI